MIPTILMVINNLGMEILSSRLCLQTMKVSITSTLEMRYNKAIFSGAGIGLLGQVMSNHSAFMDEITARGGQPLLTDGSQ